VTVPAANAAPKQRRGRPFKPGASGNPAGKAKGTRHRATAMIEELFEGEAEAIGRKAIERALAGDSVALRLCLERISPVRRGRAITFPMPTIDTTADLGKAMGAILAGVANGMLTAEEGLTVANIVETKRRAIETIELDQRLSALERAREDEGAEVP
jgi:Family of unknown function (DUF5681)